jgi:hypothetical protein
MPWPQLGVRTHVASSAAPLRPLPVLPSLCPLSQQRVSTEGGSRVQSAPARAGPSCMLCDHPRVSHSIGAGWRGAAAALPHHIEPPTLLLPPDQPASVPGLIVLPADDSGSPATSEPQLSALKAAPRLGGARLQHYRQARAHASTRGAGRRALPNANGGPLDCTDPGSTDSIASRLRLAPTTRLSWNSLFCRQKKSCSHRLKCYWPTVFAICVHACAPVTTTAWRLIWSSLFDPTAPAPRCADGWPGQQCGLVCQRCATGGPCLAAATNYLRWLRWRVVETAPFVPVRRRSAGAPDRTQECCAKQQVHKASLASVCGGRATHWP